MIVTPDEASNIPCPIARTFVKATENCRAGKCMYWRWVPLLNTDPEFKAAIQTVMAENEWSGPGHHKKAVEIVEANRSKYGLPDQPVKGFCGVAGRPTDVRWIE